MKRILLTLSVCLAIVTLTSSCKRCVECSYTYTVVGTSRDTTVSVAQKCGNKLDQESYENNVKADAALVGGVVTCTH